MGSPFFGLDIAITGLYTSQIQLNTASHNVANSETEGYTKQTVSTQAADAMSTGSKVGMVGTGVIATDITQTRDTYYDTKYRRSSGISGEYEAKSYYLADIQNYLNELDESGFTTIYNKFYETLSDMSNDPTDLDKRQAVAQEAETLMDYFNTLYGNMQAIQNDLNTEVKVQVDEINSIATQLAELNMQIGVYEMSGQTANDLRDQRNKLIDELSSICNVEVQEITINKDVMHQGNKLFVVKINGEVLVDTNKVNQLKCEVRTNKNDQNDLDGLYDVVWAATGEKLNLNGVDSTGRIKALLDVRDGNNEENLKGIITANKGDMQVVLSETNINEISRINIPEQGVLTVGGAEYEYDGFSVKQDNFGKFYYVLNLTEPVGDYINAKPAEIGAGVDCKGVPYFQSMINEFIRTYSDAFNSIHTTGEDLNGEAGMNFFVYEDKITQSQRIDIPGIAVRNGKDVFNSGDASYYKMTGASVRVNKEIMEDTRKFAASAAGEIQNGVGNKDNVLKIISLKEDNGLFKQGSASSFLQTIVSEIGVVTKNAETLSENQANIVVSIDKMRLSTSGVDVDEEGMNLIKYQTAYEMASKVFNIMNEIYQKLINETGV